MAGANWAVGQKFSHRHVYMRSVPFPASPYGDMVLMLKWESCSSRAPCFSVQDWYGGPHHGTLLGLDQVVLLLCFTLQHALHSNLCDSFFFFSLSLFTAFALY